MTKRIFRSILTVTLTVLVASLLLIVGVLHGYFQDRVLGGAGPKHSVHCPGCGRERHGVSG